MPGHSLVRRLLPIGVLVCVASCLSTEGYYRYQDAGSSGAAGTTGSAGGPGAAGNGAAGTSAGTAGVVGTGGSTAGTAGTTTTGRGGTTGAAGAAAGRGGTTGTAGAGAGGRGGTTGTAGATGTGGAGTVLFMDDFESGMTTKWDFAAIATVPVIMDGSKVLNLMESAGSQAIGAAGVATWTNYSVEARVKVLSSSGTSSSDGVSICARLTGPDSFYYLQLNNSGDAKSLKIKLNNGSNTSLSSSLDSSGFAPNTWVTLRLDVQGNVLTAYLNGTMKGSYTAVDADKILPAGGIGLMVQRTNAEFDDVVVRALP